jgi:hypothetical protein
MWRQTQAPTAGKSNILQIDMAHLDYFLVNRRMTNRVTKAHIHKEGFSSNHSPVSIVVALEGKHKRPSTKGAKLEQYAVHRLQDPDTGLHVPQ